MTSNQYNTRVAEILKEKGFEKLGARNEVKINTPFGVLDLTTEQDVKIKLTYIHSRLEGDKAGFKEWLGRSISLYNGKYNLYFSNPEECLTELNELLSNIEYLNKNGVN